MKLNIATLSYGSSAHPVESNEHTPIPLEFDFNDPEACARKVFAIMAFASGGFVISNCVLRIHRKRNTANLTANGVHVYYHDESQPLLTLDQAMALANSNEVEVFRLGTVLASPLAGRWDLAAWKPAE
jgi:hypothetical protein